MLLYSSYKLSNYILYKMSSKSRGRGSSLAGKKSIESKKKIRLQNIRKYYSIRSSEEEKYIRIVVRTHGGIYVKDPYLRSEEGYLFDSSDGSLIVYKSGQPFKMINGEWKEFVGEPEFQMKDIKTYVDLINLKSYENIENVKTYNNSEIGNKCYGIVNFSSIIKILKDKLKGKNLSIHLLKEEYEKDELLKNSGFRISEQQILPVNFVENSFNKDEKNLMLDKKYTRSGDLKNYCGIEIIDTNIEEENIKRFRRMIEYFNRLIRNKEGDESSFTRSDILRLLNNLGIPIHMVEILDFSCNAPVPYTKELGKKIYNDHLLLWVGFQLGEHLSLAYGGSRLKTKNKPKTKTKTKHKTKTKTKPKPKTKTKPKTKPKTKLKTKLKTKPKPKPKTKRNYKTKKLDKK